MPGTATSGRAPGRGPANERAPAAGARETAPRRSVWGTPPSPAPDLREPGLARVQDRLLGGKDNYAADRDLADRLLHVLPGAAAAARDGRAFTARAVRTLAGRGVRQFLDLGCGLPADDNLHQMAARHVPGARVVYVDGDPLVIAHARARLAADGVAALRADLRDPAAILASPEVRRLIDPAEPVALVFSSVLHFLADPYPTVAALAEASAPGSALVVAHATGDFAPAATAEAARLYTAAGVPLHPRGAADIERLLGPFRPLPPGIVPAARWCPDRPPARSGPPVLYGAVGVLPG
ncbi:SAM-dependent methyltransferase [Actinomadura algeriensis]|uniref:SAM-dependent methyltransferase n=1 Tax=Actinomadura algeriensis TaxID=1679523 RepID=A0ABR9JZC8_9ACTN|nr:SAM-dependent methyltransferase [Actinomadura algeriensis]MBE1535939.1 SAM-dependent methyltransferase [Actinomadura algeriensis]